jgi:hypothetical protein
MMENNSQDLEASKTDTEELNTKDLDFDKRWNVWSAAKFDISNTEILESNLQETNQDNMSVDYLKGCRKVEPDPKGSNFFKRVNCNNCVFRDDCEITRADSQKIEDSCFIGLSQEQSESALFELDKKNFEDINLRLRVKNGHIGMLERYNKELITENKRLKSDNEKLNNRVMDLAMENVNLEVRIEDVEKVYKSNEELLHKVERLNCVYARCKQDSRIVKEELEEKNNQFTIISDELDSKVNENKSLKNNIAKLVKKIITLNKLIEKSRNQLEDYQGLITNQLKTINTLTETNSSLTSKILETVNTLKNR